MPEQQSMAEFYRTQARMTDDASALRSLLEACCLELDHEASRRCLIGEHIAALSRQNRRIALWCVACMLLVLYRVLIDLGVFT